jgi:hypothetical protein
MGNGINDTQPPHGGAPALAYSGTAMTGAGILCLLLALLQECLQALLGGLGGFLFVSGIAVLTVFWRVARCKHAG